MDGSGLRVVALDDRLRRRMLIGFLAFLTLIYALPVVQAFLVNVPRSDARGEMIAVLLSVVGLLGCAPRRPPRWLYVVSLTCACIAPSAALLFHDNLEAQVWPVVPLLCIASFIRIWHRTSVARVAAVGTWLVACACLVLAPAAVPTLWLVAFAVSIIGAAEVFGMASAALVDAALRDPLTAVWNRAGVDKQAGQVFSRAARRTEPVAVVVLDFDDFKRVNDRDGHAAGDAALGEFSRLVSSRLPDSAVFGRLGGDEFVVVLRGYDVAAAHRLAGHLVHGHPVEVSYGAAAGHPGGTSLTDLFDAADADLYQRKRSRKNLAARPE